MSNSARASRCLTLAVRALAVVVALGACDSLAEFDVSQDIPEQTVQGNPLGALLPSFLPQPFAFTIDVERETEKRDTGPATSAHLSSLTFSITPHDAPKGNFDFVDEIHIFVEPSQGSALPRTEIASLVPVPKGQTTVSLRIVPNVDVLPYIESGAKISAQASGRLPAQDTKYDGRIVVTVRI